MRPVPKRPTPMVLLIVEVVELTFRFFNIDVLDFVLDFVFDVLDVHEFRS